MNLVSILLFAIVATTPVGEGAVRITLPDGQEQLIAQDGMNVRNAAGDLVPINQSIVLLDDPFSEWDAAPVETGWQMYLAAEQPWLKIVNADGGSPIEIKHATFGLHWLRERDGVTYENFLPSSSREPAASVIPSCRR